MGVRLLCSRTDFHFQWLSFTLFLLEMVVPKYAEKYKIDKADVDFGNVFVLGSGVDRNGNLRANERGNNLHAVYLK